MTKKLVFALLILCLMVTMCVPSSSVRGSEVEVFREIKTMVVSNTKPDLNGNMFLARNETENGQLVEYLIGVVGGTQIGAVEIRGSVMMIVTYDEKLLLYCVGLFLNGDLIEEHVITKIEAEKIAIKILDKFRVT